MTTGARGPTLAGGARSRSGLLSRPLVAAVLLLLSGCGEADEPAAPPAPIGTEVGQRAPAIDGARAGGEAFSRDPAQGSPSVLVFYRTATCGLCRVQLEQIQANLTAYDRVGADVIGLTLDAPDVTSTWLETTPLDFPLVSVDTATFAAWGARDDSASAPLPATFIIDGEGVIRYRHIGRNASERTTDAEVVAIIEGLRDR